jgi:hypothetical protein
MNSTVTQQDITSNGDVIARDKKIGQQIFANQVFIEPEKNVARLRRLLEKFRTEYEEDIQFRNEIDELTYYTAQQDSDGVIGLENKLKAGGREDIVNEAIQKKEIFARKLNNLRYYKSAQQIFVYLLGKIETVFKAVVRPMILSNAPWELVDQTILAQIYEPLLTELDGDEQLTNYLLMEGMLYYLTGTCHLKWHK